MLSTRARLQESDAGGVPCGGSSTREETCNTEPCPYDCLLLDWSDWRVCSTSCGQGTRSRTRVKQEARLGGKPCDEPLDEIKECTNDENALLCPHTTSTTTLQRTLYIPEPGENPLGLGGSASSNGAWRSVASANSASGVAPCVTGNKLPKAAPTAVHQPLALHKPCSKDELKAALDSYGSYASGNLSVVIDHLMKVKQAAALKARKVENENHNVAEVNGSLRLYVAEADDFVSSTEAQKAVHKALCLLTSVEPQNLKVEISLEGTFTQPAWQKKLKGNVKVAYAIQVHENDNIGDPSTLESRFKSPSMNRDEVTLAIEKELGDAGLSKFTVQATSLSVTFLH